MSGQSGVLESLHVLDTSLDPMLWTQPALTGESPGARMAACRWQKELRLQSLLITCISPHASTAVAAKF